MCMIVRMAPVYARVGLVLGLALFILFVDMFVRQSGLVPEHKEHNLFLEYQKELLGHGEKKFVATHVTKGCELPRTKAKYYSQSQEDEALYTKYFSHPNICNGTFLEIGALNGIMYSNTKFFEDSLGWKGILIEAQPQNAAALIKNRPKAFVKGEAVCAKGQNFVNFAGNGAVGGVFDKMSEAHVKRFIKNKTIIQVPCQPIGEMIQDSGFKAIDFFVLDVEGAELMVLNTMDWSIPVKVFVVEMGRGDQDQKVIDLLAHKGYHKVTWKIRDFCKPGRDCANNMVFENPKYVYL